MMTTDDAMLREWLDLEVDGALGAGERSRLAERVADSAALRGERHGLERLHTLLAESRIAVRPGFAAEIVRQLPRASWERASRAWWLPVAMAVVLAASGGLLLVRSGLESGALGTAAALFDFFQTAALAGAGMIGATWQGAGAALGELMAASRLNLAALLLAAVCLNLLLFRLIRRPRRAPALEPGERDRSSS